MASRDLLPGCQLSELGFTCQNSFSRPDVPGCWDGWEEAQGHIYAGSVTTLTRPLGVPGWEDRLHTWQSFHGAHLLGVLALTKEGGSTRFPGAGPALVLSARL